jgi:non-specific serine/threonine protein kinase
LVLPASLLGNWRSEVERFAPTLRIRAVHPAEMDAGTMAATADDPATTLAGVDLVLTTYGMLVKQAWLRQQGWSRVILDEAQAIKNPGARQTRAVKELEAPVRIALTGTPVENSLGDLWSLFDFLNPGLLGSAAEFTRTAKRLGQSPEPGAFAPLRQRVRPYIPRRLKSDRNVIADLPDKTERRALCGLTRRQTVLYAQAGAELADKLATVEARERRGVVLATLMRLKQLRNHPAHGLGTGDYAAADSGKFSRLAELAGEIAAVLDGVGARLDTQPELLLVLRGVDYLELISAAAQAPGLAAGAGAEGGAMGAAKMADVFGIEFESAAPAVAPVPAPKRRKRCARGRRKRSAGNRG